MSGNELRNAGGFIPLIDPFGLIKNECWLLNLGQHGIADEMIKADVHGNAKNKICLYLKFAVKTFIWQHMNTPAPFLKPLLVLQNRNYSSI